jgi:8-amino-7-oxononanoate synthase
LHAGLGALGFRLGAPVNAVVAVLVGDKVEALRFWDHLLKQGVYVNLMVPPATPGNESLLRCSVSAAHTPEQIDAICAAFASWSDRTFRTD